MGTLVFILVLSTLVIVHEWGHFITAKRLGVKVERFSVGFGPKLFSRMHNGTEFLVSAIPLGGYVKMAGDERSECRGLPGEFFSQPVGHRALIILMGPVVNFVFAYLCFYVILTTGFPVLSAKIGNVMDGYPAQEAGLLVGDRITQINDSRIGHWDDLQETIRASSGKVLKIHYLRAGQNGLVTISPRSETGKDDLGSDQKVWIIGIQPEEEIDLIRYGPGESVLKAASEVYKVTSLTLRALARVATGRIQAKDALAGPIRIYDLISSAATMGIAYLINIMAVISTSLAIFNLFPVPVLDGGHLFFLLIERVRGRPLPLKLEESVTKVGFSLLILLMVFVLYNDMMEVGWFAKVRALLGSMQPK